MFNTNGLEKGCFTLAELSRRSSLEFDFLAKLIEHKLIVADSPCANLYSMAQLMRLQRMCRLVMDIELEASTVVLVLLLLERVERLKTRLGGLQLALLDGQNSIIH